MTKHSSQTKTGAALLTAILLSAIIGAAALGVNAIAIRQINISETYNNGLVAFYSANSGLEEGLLRYRFDKNVQIPTVINETSDDLNRQPENVYRNYLSDDPSPDHPYMRRELSDEGISLASGYPFSDKLQVYDLAVFFQQQYFGQDLSVDRKINQFDLDNSNYGPAGTPYRIIKDETKNFSINFFDSTNNNNIYLYWKWIQPSCTSSRALEVKVKIYQPDPIASDEYTALFRDPVCASPIPNSDLPDSISGTSQKIYTPLLDSDLKAKMNISALTVSEMSLRPVGGTNDDGVVFGFSQGPGANAKTAGPTTTIKSIGYFSGASREATAEIDRQNGTILDLFNFVIHKGGS